ncbi:MAG: hypothetical protein RLZZ617_63 [Bacteroidota bacterium]
MRPLRYLSLGLQGNASKPFLLLFVYADVAKLVDVPDLGSGAARRVGSSPSIRTKLVWKPSAALQHSTPNLVFTFINHLKSIF